MRSVDSHLGAIEQLLLPVVTEVAHAPADVIAISDPTLLGRVTAEPLRTAIPLPPFDNSQMDGYAVIAHELSHASAEHPVSLRIGSTSAAGNAPHRHAPGTASPVMTGAPLPHGADAVIAIEQADPPRFFDLGRSPDPADEPTALPAAQVSFMAPVAHGQFVRRAGEDVAAHGLLVEPETVLSAAHIGLLAAAGIDRVLVRRRLRVLLCTTGDELTAPGRELTAGHVFDATGPMLAAACTALGASVQRLRVQDNAESFLKEFQEDASDIDLLVTSGGISAGAFEVVRDTLEPIGAQFVKIAMQPGGPQGSGVVHIPGRARPLPTLCFPGNPVSSMLSAELFLYPWLRRLLGREASTERTWRPLNSAVESPEHKLQLRRGTILADGSVSLTAPGSHLLSDFAQAEIIAEIPDGVRHVAAGTAIETWRPHDF